MNSALTGWGRYPVARAEGSAPPTLPLAIAREEAAPSLPRGLGRSYGDASLPAPGNPFLDTRLLDRFVAFDEATGLLEAESGVSLRDVIRTLLPRGFFLPVTPGTQFVTLGGAVASNVHGKNHHHGGSLEHFLEYVEVATPEGVMRCSPAARPDLFRATVGGYGLTGLITRVGLRMKRVTSPRIHGRALRRGSLAGLFQAFRDNDSGCEYSVAWIDTLARGRSLGRGVLLLGDHVPSANGRPEPVGPSRHQLFRVPFPAPGGLLRPWALRLFNTAYYRLPRSEKASSKDFEGYFYPLDILGDWNVLYGPRGFFQYQFVIPDPRGEEGVEECLRFLAENGMGSFLAVLKRCGDDSVMLPFCRRGYTLALDIPHRGEETLRKLDRLDALVLKYGGRVYLTKDARLPKETFRAMYPEWKTWMESVRRYNPEGRGRSLMSERLGLWE
jgi:decaprenylphospho-beta-D-ribofuranose 2-oxidase